ncbi:hypothetical protein [Stappia indica]|uniref:hypothetical protein n=1 Tax=Stappia indica TaxID=538381 RepID=UPI000832B7AC|nr:hypothetical protein [Stappia indica]
MKLLARVSDHVRWPKDPKVVKVGPSVRPVSDSVARALGWFSIGLGAVQLCLPHKITRALGMQGKETLVRTIGLREISSGVTSLSTERAAGLWSRVGGDLLDLATLLPEYRRGNPKNENVGLALAAVGVLCLIDLSAAKAVTERQSRRGPFRNYGRRSGFPAGVEASRGAAIRPQAAARSNGSV